MANEEKVVVPHQSGLFAVTVEKTIRSAFLVRAPSKEAAIATVKANIAELSNHNEIMRDGFRQYNEPVVVSAREVESDGYDSVEFYWSPEIGTK
ncbi:MAG: hypothetical protein BWY98_01103 [Tenericutes bacterium ADurb.BinA155]|jgi:hypothetical protein|nr:MAG: hypothetical protein BWY98_01103 [Tenericutes bacterium ADurb.BinA155]